MRTVIKKIAPMFLFSLLIAGVAYAGTYYLPTATSSPADWSIFATSSYHHAAVSDDFVNETCGSSTPNNTYIYTSTSGTVDVLKLSAHSGNTIEVTPCVKQLSSQTRGTTRLRVKFSATDGALGHSSNQVSDEKAFTIPTSSNPGWVSLSPQTFTFPFNISNHATSTLEILLKHEGTSTIKLTNIASFIQ